MRRLVLVLLALALVACGVPQDDAPRTLDRATAPFRFFEGDVAPPAQGALEVELWFLRGDQPVPSTRPLELPGSPGQVLEALLAGPTQRELSDGLASAVPQSLEVVDLSVADGVAVVTLDLAGVNEQVQVPAYAQMVATLDGRPGIEGVRFRTRDADVQVPRGDGTLASGAVTRDDYAVLLGLRPSPAPQAEPAPPEADVSPSPG